jgi:RNA polymerase sigma-70 factor, ECF subfamily
MELTLALGASRAHETAQGSEPCDSLLVARVVNGDQEAFRTLVERHQGPVFALCHRMMRNTHDAEECAQAAFVRAYRALPSYRRDASFATWIHRIATNACLDALRRKKVRPDLGAGGTDESLPEPAPNPGQVAVKNELREAVTRALADVPDRYRVPLALFYIDELECTEIAERLRAPVATVKTHLRRGRMALRDIFIKQWPDLARDTGLMP